MRRDSGQRDKMTGGKKSQPMSGRSQQPERGNVHTEPIGDGDENRQKELFGCNARLSEDGAMPGELSRFSSCSAQHLDPVKWAARRACSLTWCVRLKWNGRVSIVYCKKMNLNVLPDKKKGNGSCLSIT